MERRTFLALVPGSLLAAPLVAQAQPAGKVWRIGVLSSGSPSATGMGRIDAFKRGLRELGYVEGRNIVIEPRWGEGKYETLPGLAAELVRLKMDVILTAAVPAIRAAKEATGTIPIVMAVVVDPVETGLVASFARPGGNITDSRSGPLSSWASSSGCSRNSFPRPQEWPSSGIPEISVTRHN